MNIEAVEALLTESIQQWMTAPRDDVIYHHGNAQGIARALAALRGTTFTIEWVAGLDRYQNRIVTGDSDV